MITSARFIIPLVVFPFDLYVSLGETDVRFRQGLLRHKSAEWCDKMVKDMDVKPLPGNGRFGRDEGLYIIRTGVYPRTTLDYGTLQHELFHFLERLLSDIGVEYHIDYSGEIYAYLTDYLTREIYEKLWATEDK